MTVVVTGVGIAAAETMAAEIMTVETTVVVGRVRGTMAEVITVAVGRVKVIMVAEITAADILLLHITHHHTILHRMTHIRIHTQLRLLRQAISI